MRSIDPRGTATAPKRMRLMSEKTSGRDGRRLPDAKPGLRNDHFDWRLNLPAIGTAVPVLCAFPTELQRVVSTGRPR